MAGGKRRHGRNPTAGGTRHVPELPSFVSPTSVAAAFSSSSTGGRGRGRGCRRGGASPSAADCSHAVPFSYSALRPCSAASEGAAQVLEVTIDTAPCADPAASVPVYSYGPEVVGGLGLGFPGEEDANDEEAGEGALHLGLGFRDGGSEEMEVEADELEEASFVTPRQSKGRRNEGFLSIGGVRIYTEDTSSPESEGMSGSDGESESDHEVRGGSSDGDSDEEVSADEEGDSESNQESSGSDSEEDLALGIHRLTTRLLPITWRGSAGVNLADSDDEDQMDTDEDGFMKKGKEKLEGYALQR